MQKSSTNKRRLPVHTQFDWAVLNLKGQHIDSRRYCYGGLASTIGYVEEYLQWFGSINYHKVRRDIIAHGAYTAVMQLAADFQNRQPVVVIISPSTGAGG